MNFYGSVKRNLSAAGASGAATTTASPSMASPKPMERLHDSSPPPFLTKTYDIVEDSSTNNIVSWSRGNNSFVVWDPQAFSFTLLPKYFKHNNFSSFVRQLNTYGFRKVDPDRWEFANEGFLRGQKHLLNGIRRRKNPTSPASNHGLDSCVEVGSFGLDGEIDRLRRDKQVLMAELVKLRHQQLNTKACIQVMEERLRRTETKQQHMMSFLARAMKNPAFMQQLAQEKDKRRELEETISKKRRRRIGQGHCDLGGVLGGAFVKVEPEEYGDIAELEVPDLDQIAMEMPGMGESDQLMSPDEEPLVNRLENETRLDEWSWEDLLGEQETGVVCVDDIEDGEVDVLVDQLEFLGSNSPKSRF